MRRTKQMQTDSAVECLAIKLATHAFRVFLLGKPFIIRMDQREL